MLGDLFSNLRTKRCQGECILPFAQSANPLTSPAKRRQLLCSLSSRLFSHFSVPISAPPFKFHFTSFTASAFSPGWQEWCFEFHIFCLFWMVFEQVTAGFQCFSQCFFRTRGHKDPHLPNSRHLGNSVAHWAECYVTPKKSCVHVCSHIACCHQCNLRCDRDELEAMSYDWQMRRVAVAGCQESNLLQLRLKVAESV